MDQLTKDRAQAAVDIIADVWRSIDLGGASGMRLMGIYDELAGKVRASARCKNLRQFHARLCRMFGVRSTRSIDLAATLDREDGQEILQLIRTETTYLIMIFRAQKDAAKEKAAC